MPAIGQPLPARHGLRVTPLPAQPTDPIPEHWQLRDATPADAHALAALDTVLFPDEAWDEVMVREEITHPARRYVCAVACGSNSAGGEPENPATPESPVDPASASRERVLGYAGIMLGVDVADLHTIGTVHPGQGIGQALLTWCEEKAAAGGAARLLLEVRADNARARAFYRTAGYSELGRRRGYYHTPTGAIDALVMEKQL